MSSKRAIRRREERQRQLLETSKATGMLETSKATGTKGMSKFTGNTGRTTSVAELILARSRLLKGGIGNGPVMESRPSIQVVNPKNGAPLEATAAPLAHESLSDVSQSQHHKDMIFKEAQENTDYYLGRQAEAKSKGQYRPWFHFVRKESQYSEFVMLNTQMTLELLAATWTEEDGNRKIKDWLKDAYRRDIDNGHWVPSDESIGIDFKHVVYNGRHRLTAMAESGKEWPFYITFNSLEEAKFTCDSGAKRNGGEKLRMVVDAKLGNRTIGFCKAIMRGIQPRFRYTETEIAEFAHKWQDLINWISKHYPTGRAEVQAAIAKAYLFYGPDKIEQFAERLSLVRFTQDGDPAQALFFSLQRSKVNRSNVALVAYKKTLQCIDYAISGRPLARVVEREEDIFQWQEGWELPANAWYKNQSKEKLPE